MPIVLAARFTAHIVFGRSNTFECEFESLSRLGYNPALL
jgi:hypothetical protein